MDIIVTTPLREIKNSREEAKQHEKHGGRFFRAVARRPKKLGSGDKIFFVEAGEITGFGTVSNVTNKPAELKCSTTARTWSGFMIFYGDWQFLTEPVPYKGFQGFRYTCGLDHGLRFKIGAAMPGGIEWH